MITQESRFAYPQNYTGLLSNQVQISTCSYVASGKLLNPCVSVFSSVKQGIELMD